MKYLCRLAVVAFACVALLSVAFVPPSWSQEQGSNGFATVLFTLPGGVPLGPEPATFEFLELPAGHYIVNASITLFNRSHGVPASIACLLLFAYAPEFRMELQPGSNGTLVMNGAITLSSPGGANVRCAASPARTGSNATVIITTAGMTAISVATLTIQ